MEEEKELESIGWTVQRIRIATCETIRQDALEDNGKGAITVLEHAMDFTLDDLKKSKSDPTSFVMQQFHQFQKAMIMHDKQLKDQIKAFEALKKLSQEHLNLRRKNCLEADID